MASGRAALFLAICLCSASAVSSNDATSSLDQDLTATEAATATSGDASTVTTDSASVFSSGENANSSNKSTVTVTQVSWAQTDEASSTVSELTTVLSSTASSASSASPASPATSTVWTEATTAIDSSASATATGSTEATTSVRPNITSYEEAVIIDVKSDQSVQYVQATIANEFDSLFLEYCVNMSVSCPYKPQNATSLVRLPLYFVIYLETLVDNVHDLYTLTLSVRYLDQFVGANTLVDFFRASAFSFSGLNITASVTYSSAQPQPVKCDDTGGLIAAVVVLSVILASVLLALGIYAILKYCKPSDSYSEFAYRNGNLNMTMASSIDSNERRRIASGSHATYN